MKTKTESKIPAVRNQYTAQFKEQALERADRDGIPTVAKDLELAESMLYSWRAKRRQTDRPFEEQKLQQAEMARLKRQKCAAGRGGGLPYTHKGHLKKRRRTLPNSPSEVRHDQGQ